MPLSDLVLLAPWIYANGDAADLEDQLDRAIGPGHVLHGARAVAVARRQDNEDVLFVAEGTPRIVAVVRMTHATELPADSDGPMTRSYASVEDWVESGMKTDHANFEAMPEEERRSMPMRRALGQLHSRQSAVVGERPLHARPAEIPTDDEPPSEYERTVIAAVAAADIAMIDAALLAHVGANWRKVAMVVAQAMTDVRGMFPEVPGVYYAQRVASLVERGLVEAVGNLRRMRFSEVRRPRGPERS